jgi:DNA-binding HxlR family transcriptional regulator
MDLPTPSPLSPAAESVVGLLQHKWNLLILFRLLERPHSFCQLHRGVSPISAKMLTRRLRDLRAHDLVEQRSDGGELPRMVYALTPHGEAVREFLCHLRRWGMTCWPLEERFERCRACPLLCSAQ